MSTPKQLIDEGTALYNKGDAEGFCSLYADAAVLITPDGRFEGRDTITPYVRGLIVAFPNGEVVTGRHCECGELYFGEFTMRGVNAGPLAMPDGTELGATHQSVSLDGHEIAHARDGEIIRHDMIWDNASFLAQLGLMSP